MCLWTPGMLFLCSGLYSWMYLGRWYWGMIIGHVVSRWTAEEYQMKLVSPAALCRWGAGAADNTTLSAGRAAGWQAAWLNQHPNNIQPTSNLPTNEWDRIFQLWRTKRDFLLCSRENMFDACSYNLHHSPPPLKWRTLAKNNIISSSCCFSLLSEREELVL